jgi:AcrR family transcriptional regulator
MAQRLKDEVRERIVDAALSVFAEEGWTTTSMALIAERAGLSVGNLYRYFPGKLELLEAAIGADTAAELESLASSRIRSMSGSPLSTRTGREAEEAGRVSFVSAVAGRRRELAFLCGGAGGSPREGFPERLADSLAREFQAYALSVGADPERLDAPMTGVILRSLYRNLAHAFRAIFLSAGSEPELASALDALLGYHIAGVAALLDTLTGKGV